VSFGDRLRHDRALDHLVSDLGQFKALPRAQALVTRLQATAATERLTLVLGAGVSHTVKLPLWSDLVDRLLEEALSRTDAPLHEAKAFLLSGQLNPLRQVAVLGEILQFRATLIDLLRRSLYATYDPSREGALLEPICTALLATDVACRVTNVITYNFDNTLELCLERLGIPHRLVSSEADYTDSRRGLRVFHPHGLLPLIEDDRYSDKLTFAEPDYHLDYRDHTHWANVLQQHHFRSKRCLFVGLSLDDPNLRRLLSFQSVRKTAQGEARHIAVQRRSSSETTNYFIACELALFGVEVLWIDDFEELGQLVTSCFSSGSQEQRT
jgi:hypothetical protein